MPSDSTQPNMGAPLAPAAAALTPAAPLAALTPGLPPAALTRATPPAAPTPTPHPPDPAITEARIEATMARIKLLQRAAAARERRAQTRSTRAAKPGLVYRDVSATGWTADKQRAFLSHLAIHGCVSHAAAHVGLSKQSAYALRHRGGRTMFALAWDVAVRMARKALLDEALERAFAGRTLPIWYRGEQIGERIVHNDRLMMQLLAHTLEPLASAHDEATLTQFWPRLLADIDAELPPDTAALDDPDQRENGNDGEAE